MSQNIQINPQSRDYVVENGSPIPSDRIFEKAYIALLIPRNQWLYGVVGQGSELYKFINAKRLNTTEQLFASRSIDAITKQLIETGDATQVAVSNIATSRTGTSNNIAIQPNQQNISAQYGFTSL